MNASLTDNTRLIVLRLLTVTAAIWGLSSASKPNAHPRAAQLAH